MWSPARLLADLELRLGLASEPQPTGLRIASWQERLFSLASRAPFYARSLAIDPLGTAEALLALRDSLVEAGWDGEDVPDAGQRLQALAELERHAVPELPAGFVDRLREVEQALTRFPHRIYDEVCLAEPASHWPLRWGRIFESLACRGTRVVLSEEAVPGASHDSDLKRLQVALERGATDAPTRVDGDGSFVLLTADTSWEAARATAAILGELDAEHTAVIREGDGSALDHALATLGLPTQGLRARSSYRGALQVLPLALELTFEPKDPYRVLELLIAPGGPFSGRVARRLTRALARSPGIGGPAWEQEKVALVERQGGCETGAANDVPATDPVQRISEWLEGPTADPIIGAPKALLLAVVERVRQWLLSRIASSPEDGSLLAAARVAAALRTALERDTRERLDLLAVRRLSSVLLADGSSEVLLPEQSGRIEHVGQATALAVPRRNVVWWFFADGGHRPARLPWRRQELRALAAAGVHFPDPRARLLELAKQRRRAFRCATGRLILVSPRACARDRLPPDPLWDELRAVAQLDDAACERLTSSARQLLAPSDSAGVPAPRLVPLQPARLPGGHVDWNIGSVEARNLSATSLGALLACPLRWVLSYAAALRSTRRSLPQLHMLAGTLGHRLVEELHRQGIFEQPEAVLAERARAELALLLPREGALLLRPGMSFERSQVEAQLLHAVAELARALRRANLRIIGVEQPLRRPWRGGELEGRIDLLVAGPDGGEHILDLKYGVASYRDALKEGRALQLAAYGAVHGHGRERPTEAAFFTLKRARFVGLASARLPIEQPVQGRSLEATWSAIERTMDAMDATLARGRVPVTGLRRSLPLVESLGIDRSEQQACFSARRESVCDYCELDVLCGRRWEVEHDRS
ncbi:MAG TPA: PD-(D/E)XK nuclease family protein [Polyangiaceae bacterium]|nr:PD-(D/E)XK nuclease family protein [Polyangiaceae bacterium]